MHVISEDMIHIINQYIGLVHTIAESGYTEESKGVMDSANYGPYVDH